MNSYVERVLNQLNETYPWEKEFLQAASEVLESLDLVMDREPRYENAKILERIVEPERVVLFKVEWQDDNGKIQVNRDGLVRQVHWNGNGLVHKSEGFVDCGNNEAECVCHRIVADE